MASLIFFNAILVSFLAVSMLFPALIAFQQGQDAIAEAFFISAAIILFASISATLSLRGKERSLVRSRYLLLVVCVWLILPGFAAFPIWMIGEIDFITSYFQAVSSLTTTNIPLFEVKSEVSNSIIFWHAELQWLGGLLTLTMIFVILAPYKVGGLSNEHIRVMNKSRDQALRFGKALSQVLSIYVVLSFLAFIAMLLAGLHVFDALVFTLTSLSTGGLIPSYNSIDLYSNAALDWILIITMFTGASSFIWISMIYNGQWRSALHHRETYYLLGLCLMVTFLSIFLGSTGQTVYASTFSESFRHHLFSTVSKITTTGYNYHEERIAFLPFELALILSFLGACSFSTAGGIKLYRLGGMMAQSTRELYLLLYPHGALPRHFGNGRFDEELIKSVWSYFIVIVVTLGLICAVLSVNTPSFEQGLMAAIAVLSNTGGILELQWGHVGQFNIAEMTFGTCSIMILGMILGRIEVIILLVVLSYGRV